MEIKCPHCSNAYVLDHQKLRDKEICPRCNRVTFVYLLKKSFAKKTCRLTTRVIYLTITIILVGLTAFLTNSVNRKHHEEKLSRVNTIHSEMIEKFNKEFEREIAEKDEKISRLKEARDALLIESKGLEVKLKTQDIALSELVKETKVLTGDSEIEESCKPVEFADNNLKKIVEDTLGIQNPTAEDMLELRVLHGTKCNISNLNGLGYANNLEEIDLSRNQIRNVDILSELINIKVLIIDNNLINRIDSLSNLKSLKELVISNNPIQEVSVLENFHQLEKLHIGGRPLDIDLSPIKNLRSLKTLWIHSIPIQDSSWVYELDKIENLTLASCGINNIDGIEAMVNLKSADLQLNNIKDPRPLLKIGSLETYNLNGNFSKKVIQKFNAKFNTMKTSRKM